VPFYLTEADVAGRLTPAAAAAAVESSLRRLAVGAVRGPAIARLELPDGDVAAQSCVDLDLGYAGVTTSVRLPDGRPSVLVLYSLATAEPAAVVEARHLRALRAAAVSTLAVRHLSRPGAKSLGVFGYGRQAAAHVAALREVAGLADVAVFGPDARRLAAFCEEHGCAAAEESRDVAERDVVVTATTSVDPVVRGEWLSPGALVIALGANEPTARELDNVVLERASFVCTDSTATARLVAGDLIEPVERGVLDWLEVHELHQVVTGELHGREGDDDIVLFKACGFAAGELALAALLI
jgi:ornithine cyclodeaminase/alanine dehydrogenase-like protein (mu-crystallin family)